MSEEKNNVVKLETVQNDIKRKAANIRNNNKITKIKVSKSRTMEVLYSKANAQKYGKETIYKGFEEMLGQKYEKVQELRKHVCEMLEFPTEWVEMLTVTGISFNYDYDNEFKTAPLRGMVITLQKQLNGLNCPLNINTPFIKFASYIEECTNFEDTSEATWAFDVEQLVEEIIDNACMYMSGETKTTQTKLFDVDAV